MVLLIILLEVGIRNIPNDYKFKKKYLDQNASKINTLILGNSHLFYGLDPVYFSKPTFNACNVAQSLNYDYEIFKKYENALTEVKTIIIPVSYSGLWADIEKTTEAWRVKNYVIYYGINRTKFIKEQFELTSNKFPNNLDRAYNYYVKGNDERTCSDLGWGTKTNAKDSRDLEKTAKIAAKRHTRESIDAEEQQLIYTQNVKIIRSIIERCKAKNISVLIVTPPAYKAYRELINPKQLSRTTNTLKQIAGSFDNCDYICLIDDGRFFEEDFFDADHLNNIGAKKLSLIIDDEIDKQH